MLITEAERRIVVTALPYQVTKTSTAVSKTCLFHAFIYIVITFGKKQLA